MIEMRYKYAEEVETNRISGTHNSFRIIFRTDPHKNANINQTLPT